MTVLRREGARSKGANPNPGAVLSHRTARVFSCSCLGHSPVQPLTLLGQISLSPGFGAWFDRVLVLLPLVEQCRPDEAAELAGHRHYRLWRRFAARP